MDRIAIGGGRKVSESERGSNSGSGFDEEPRGVTNHHGTKDSDSESESNNGSGFNEGIEKEIGGRRDERDVRSRGKDAIEIEVVTTKSRRRRGGDFDGENDESDECEAMVGMTLRPRKNVEYKDVRGYEEIILDCV